MADRIACLNVTLHYHDVPERIPAELVYRMFACDLQAASDPMNLMDFVGLMPIIMETHLSFTATKAGGI